MSGTRLTGGQSQKSESQNLKGNLESPKADNQGYDKIDIKTMCKDKVWINFELCDPHWDYLLEDRWFEFEKN